MFAELSNYLDEQLDDSLCEELERHLDGCGPCKVFLASLEATIEQCRRLPAECPTGEKSRQAPEETDDAIRPGRGDNPTLNHSPRLPDVLPRISL